METATQKEHDVPSSTESSNRTVVAERLGALTCDWFTRLMRDGGYPQVTVTRVSIEPTAFTGGVGDMARLRLSYGDGPTGPVTLIAKTRGSTEFQIGLDAALGLFVREARFYDELASRVPLSSPRCYHVGDGTRTPLLLEDLGDLRFGDQEAGLRVGDAERLIDNLADMHARYWEAPALDQDWLASPTEGLYAGMLAQLIGSGAEVMQARYRGNAPDWILDAVVNAVPRWGEIMTHCTAGPKTLAHGDCRLDNIFFREDDEPVFVDWQVVACTRGTHDVGKLLANSMNESLVRSNWEPILRRYHARLSDRGISDYSWEQCLEHYRQNVLNTLGEGLAMLGHAATEDSRMVADTIVLRALHHSADLDSFAVV